MLNTKDLLEALSEFRKVVGYKVDIKESTVFLESSNKQLKIKT